MVVILKSLNPWEQQRRLEIRDPWGKIPWVGSPLKSKMLEIFQTPIFFRFDVSKNTASLF